MGVAIDCLLFAVPITRKVNIPTLYLSGNCLSHSEDSASRLTDGSYERGFHSEGTFFASGEQHTRSQSARGVVSKHHPGPAFTFHGVSPQFSLSSPSGIEGSVPVPIQE